MVEEPKTRSENASAEAVLKTQEAQEAVETARKVQAEESDAKHLDMMIKALKVVFPEEAHKEDDQMKIYLPRVPLICKDIQLMKLDISGINDNIKWVVRLVLGAVILAAAAFYFKH